MAKSINDAIKMEITAPADCVKEFNFTIAADAVKSESSKVLSYISSMVQIPGFRAGKAPIGMVKSKYADSIEEELRNRIVSGAVSKIEDEKDIEILTLNFKSAPDFKLDGSEDIAFTFEANIMPQINVGDYKAIKVEVPSMLSRRALSMSVSTSTVQCTAHSPKSMVPPSPMICSRRATPAISLPPRMPLPE
ncbi:MAG: hypothetical protein J6W67_03520 [Lentisphaeria bacterium]|nr:hypothetical protein [Lentisphaeria bacterium]